MWHRYPDRMSGSTNCQRPYKRWRFASARLTGRQIAAGTVDFTSDHVDQPPRPRRRSRRDLDNDRNSWPSGLGSQLPIRFDFCIRTPATIDSAFCSQRTARHRAAADSGATPGYRCSTVITLASLTDRSYSDTLVLTLYSPVGSPIGGPWSVLAKRSTQALGLRLARTMATRGCMA